MDFGTSGLRGLVTDMTDAACAAWTRAFLDHLVATGRPATALLVGRDLRPSSPRIARAVLAAAAGRGLRALDCGALPTPALALEALARGVPAAMVTGSHIPFDRNGIKFYAADGEITKADEAGVKGALAAAGQDRPGGAVERAEGVAERYVARTLGAFPPRFLAGRRIGVRQHSAVGRDLMVAALEAAGAAVTALDRAEDFVPIDTEAVSAGDAAQARAWVAAHRLDALATTDGDGDRPLVADETGAFLRGDVLGILVARFLGADAVACPVNANSALEASGWFARTARTRIGSPYVIEAMGRLAAEGARLPVAFEANGGFLLGASVRGPSGATLAALPTRDALLPILAVLAMAGDGPLSGLRTLLPARFTASDRLQDTPPALTGPFLDRLAADPAARAAFAAPLGLGAEMALDLTDGVRMSFADGRVLHLRRSGNAPELRAYAEGPNEAAATALAAAALAAAAGALCLDR